MTDVRSGAGPGPSFTVFYPLAFLGAHLAFMPLLILLLPRRVAELEPSSATYHLSLLLLAGGVTASVAHIAAGRWSDRFMARLGSRRLPIAAGLALCAASYAGLAHAGTIAALLLAVIGFQVALNIMFSPLGALLADYVEDGRKARTTAWLTLALPVSIAATALVASAWPSDSDSAFFATALAVMLCVLPLLIFWPACASEPSPAPGQAETGTSLPYRDFRLAWGARLLVQCGAALVIHYLYLYLAGLPASSGIPTPLSGALTTLLTVAAVGGAAATIAAGQISDRFGRRRAPIAWTGAASCAGLLLLALRPEWPLIVAGYCLFSAGLTAFLAVDSAMVATLLGDSAKRGEWLGIMNLTNTLPAIITPALALGAVQITAAYGISVLLLMAAAAAACASWLITMIRSVR